MPRILRTAVLALALPLFAGDRTPQAPVNINTASVTELMQLPKVGAKTAERIVAYRKQHGGFKRTEELMNVKGIGEKSFAKLRTHLSVGTKPANKP
ncbi:ComEA family DNA-binding protein [Holophaga foetida]|uniref:ComEA family DNA-binding protein n=1 Tax=Holophaga foetida TaxID=35839 RepID=UPI0002473F26|nr:helix-hairpin-helix domain-containing protein [Holophaga foetida]